MDMEHAVANAFRGYIDDPGFEGVVQSTAETVSKSYFNPDGFAALAELYTKAFEVSLVELSNALVSTIEAVCKGGYFNQNDTHKLAWLLIDRTESLDELRDSIISLAGNVSSTYFNAEGRIKLAEFYLEVCPEASLTEVSSAIDATIRGICGGKRFNQDDALELARLFEVFFCTPKELKDSILTLAGHAAGKYVIEEILVAARQLENEDSFDTADAYATAICKMLPR